MSNTQQAQKALIGRILEGDGKTSPAERMAAFHNRGVAGPCRTLIEKVACHADRVTNEDITALKVSGFTEDQIFEIVVCAAVGQANRQYEAALAALKDAVEKR